MKCFSSGGNKNLKPSERNGPFVLVEVEATIDTPIFLEGQEEALLI